MKCIICNNETVENVHFCPNCGSNMKAESVTVGPPLTHPRVKSKKSKTKPIIISCSIALAAIVGLIAGYMLLMTPQKIFKASLNVVYEKFTEIMNQNSKQYNSVNSEFKISAQMSVPDDSMKDLENLLKNISISGKTAVDLQNKKVLIEIDSKYKSDELIKAGIVESNDNIYMILNDLFNKNIVQEAEGFNKIFDTNNLVEDSKTFIDELYKAFINSLEKDYFESETVKMNVNGKETKVNKISLILNKENKKEMEISLLNKLKESDKFLDSYLKITGEEITKEEVKQEIEEYISEYDEYSEDITRTIILYVKPITNKFVGFEINEEEYGIARNISLINDKENAYTLTLKNDGVEVTTGTLTIKENVYTFATNYEDQKILISYNSQTKDIEVSADNEETIGSITIKNNSNNNKDIIFKVAMDEIEATIKVNLIIKYNETIKLPSLNNNVNIDNLTQEDMSNILNKLMEKQGVINLMTDLQNIFAGPELDEPETEF